MGAPLDFRKQPIGYPVLDLQVFNADARQTYNATSGDEPAGIKRTGTHVALLGLLSGSSCSPFHQPADQASTKNGQCGRNRNIEANRKGKGANPQNLNSNNKKNAEQDQSPG